MSHMKLERSWTDADLREAVQQSRSWRGVSKALGLRGSNPTRFRLRAEELGIDSAHFTGKRQWSDDELRAAIAASTAWPEVVTRLGLSQTSGTNPRTIRVHAVRLGIDVTHLSRKRAGSGENFRDSRGVGEQIRRAAEPVAMAWFALRGWTCSVPNEPCSYDLIVDMSGVLKKVQVKSCTRRDAEGRPYCRISHSRYVASVPGLPYSSDEVDLFFIVDGDLEVYVVPLEATAGQVSISMHMYGEYRVGSIAGLM